MDRGIGKSNINLDKSLKLFLNNFKQILLNVNQTIITSSQETINNTQIGMINKWAMTILFMNKYNSYLKSIKETIQFNNLQAVLDLLNEIINSISNEIHSNIINTPFISYTYINEHFYSLEDYDSESKAIKELLSLTEVQTVKITSVLHDYVKVANCLMISKSMIQIIDYHSIRISNRECYEQLCSSVKNNRDISLNVLCYKCNEIYSRFNAFTQDFTRFIIQFSNSLHLIDTINGVTEEEIEEIMYLIGNIKLLKDLVLLKALINRLNIQRGISEECFINNISQILKSDIDLSIIHSFNNDQLEFIKSSFKNIMNKDELVILKAKNILLNCKIVYCIDKDKEPRCDIMYMKNYSKAITNRELYEVKNYLMQLSLKPGNNNESIKKIINVIIDLLEAKDKIIIMYKKLKEEGYINLNNKTITISDSDLSNMTSYINDLNAIYSEWKDSIKETYHKYYLLTNYYGYHFGNIEHYLNNNQILYLSNLICYAIPHCSINQLKYIPLLRLDPINTSLSPKERLNQLASNLNTIISSLVNNKIIEERLMIDDNDAIHNLLFNDKPIALISVDSDYMLLALLSIYLSHENKLMPQARQLVFYSSSTTIQELHSFYYKVISSPNHSLYSIIINDKLSEEAQSLILDLINQLSTDNQANLLIISGLGLANDSFIKMISFNDKIHHLTQYEIIDQSFISNILYQLNLNVFIIHSDISGVGKSYYIQQKFNEEIHEYYYLPINDVIDVNKLTNQLNHLFKEFNENDKQKFLHIHIGDNIDNYQLLDYILFTIIVLGCLKSDNDAFIYNCKENSIYIEVANYDNNIAYNSCKIFQLLSFNDIYITLPDAMNSLTYSDDINSPIQLVMNYLLSYDQQKIDVIEIEQSTLNNMIVLDDYQIKYLLDKYLISKCRSNGRDIIIPRHLYTFIDILYNELTAFGANPFLKIDNILYIRSNLIENIRSIIIEKLLLMAFDITFGYNEITTASSSFSKYIIFHHDSICLSLNIASNDTNYQSLIEMFSSQLGYAQQLSQLSSNILYEKLLLITGHNSNSNNIADCSKATNDYILSNSTFIKTIILLIRIKNALPIIIIGNKGSGKSSFIHFFITKVLFASYYKISLGYKVSQGYLNDEINKALLIASSSIHLWVILEDINYNREYFGTVTDIIANRYYNGIKLPSNISFITTLTRYSDSIDTLSHYLSFNSVYFHPLTSKEELFYIKTILMEMKIESNQMKQKTAELVYFSHDFIRKCKNECPVGINELKKFVKVYQWYNTIYANQNQKENNNEKQNNCISKENSNNTNASTNQNKIIIINNTHYKNKKQKNSQTYKALIHSLIICYYNTIEKTTERKEFKIQLGKALDITVTEIDSLLHEEYNNLLNHFNLSKDTITSLTIAQKEIIYLIYVCISIKIPLVMYNTNSLIDLNFSVNVLIDYFKREASFLKELLKIVPVNIQGDFNNSKEEIEFELNKAKATSSNSMQPLIIVEDISQYYQLLDADIDCYSMSIICLINNIQCEPCSQIISNNSIDLIKQSIENKEIRNAIIITNNEVNDLYLLANYFGTLNKDKTFIRDISDNLGHNDEYYHSYILFDDNTKEKKYIMSNRNSKEYIKSIESFSINNCLQFIIFLNRNQLSFIPPLILYQFDIYSFTPELIMSKEQIEGSFQLKKWIDLIFNPNINKGIIIEYNETMHKYIYLQCYNNHNQAQSNEQILLQSKEAIVNICNYKVIPYISLLKQKQEYNDISNKLLKTYLSQSHDSLYQLILSNPKKAIVYTYSNINEPILLKDINYDIIHFNKHHSLNKCINNKADLLLIKTNKPQALCQIINAIDRKEINNERVIILYYMTFCSDYIDCIQYSMTNDWIKMTIDYLNGGIMKELIQMMKLSFIELIKSKINQRLFSIIIKEIYTHLSFSAMNTDCINKYNHYISQNISTLQNDPSLYQLIHYYCIDYLETHQQHLIDWKQTIINNSNDIPIIEAIDLFIIEEYTKALKQIVLLLEKSSSIYCYANGNEFIKDLWKKLLDKTIRNKLAFSINQSEPIINCIFKLSFPFSRIEIEKIVASIKEDINTVHLCNMNDYYKAEDNYLSYYNHITNVTASNHINTVISQSFIIKTLYSSDTFNDNDKEIIITLYYKDITTYFLLTEIKIDLATIDLISIIIDHCFAIKTVDFLFDLFTFLYTNITNLKLIADFLVLLYSKESFNKNGHSVIEYKRLEELLKDKALYSNKEENVFSVIYNRLLRVLIELIMNEQSEWIIKQSIEIVTKAYESFYTLSFDKRHQLKDLRLITVTKEYLKRLLSSSLSQHNHQLVDFIYQLWNNKTIEDDVDYEQIESNLIPTQSTQQSLNVLSSQVIVYQNILFLIKKRNTRQNIINQLLSNDELLIQSSYLLYQIFNNPLDIDNHIKISESNIDSLLLNENKVYFDNYYDSNPHAMKINSISSCFIVEFFIKLYSHQFLHSNDTIELLNYLISTYESFAKAISLIKDKPSQHQISFYDKLVSYSIIKHYLNLYGKHLSLLLKSNEIKQEASLNIEHIELNTKLSIILSNANNDTLTEIMVLYALKSISYYLSYNLSSLTNSEVIDSLQIGWINQKLFQSKENSLGLEPGGMRYNKYKKMNYFIFSNLLKEKNVNPKINELIKSSTTKEELKYVIIQTFVLKIWLNYSTKGFINSKEHKIALNLYNTIEEVLLSSYGKPITLFIRNLIYNWPENPQLQLSPNLPHSISGLILFGMEVFTYIISLCSNNISYLSTLFYQKNNKGINEIITSFNHWKKLYIPGGLIDGLSESMIFLKNDIELNYENYGVKIGLYECLCGFLYTIGDCTRPSVNAKCPKCKGVIGGKGHVIQIGHEVLINADQRRPKNEIISKINTKIHHYPGYIPKMPDEMSQTYTLRDLLPITFRFFHYVTHITLYLFNECSFISSEAINTIISSDEEKSNYFLKHITRDINIIKSLLDDNDGYIFIFLIYDIFTRSIINDDMNYAIDTNNKRLNIEMAFNGKVKQKYDKISEEIEYFMSNRKKENKEFSYYALINEDFSEEEIRYLLTYEYQRLFRFTQISNWNEMTIDFYKKNLQLKYPLINLLINHYDDLTIVSSCLTSIIYFSNYMLKKYNNTFYRQEAKDRTIEEVIKDDPDAIQLYKKFESVWNAIGYKINRYGCKELTPIHSFNKVLSVSFVLLDDKEMGYGLYLIAALQYLATIQNDFLASVHGLLKEKNALSECNIDINKYPIQYITDNEITLCSEDNETINRMMLHYIKFNYEYKQGAIINYDFDMIEHDLIHLLTFNKKYINIDTYSTITFKLELLSLQSSQSNLIDDILLIIPQIEINDIVKGNIANQLNQITISNPLFIHQISYLLEEVLLYIKYDQSFKTNPKQNSILLKDYINQNDLKHHKKLVYIMRNCSINTDDLFSIPLENIISLYEIIELLIFDGYKDNISIDYKKTIANEYKDKIKDYIKSSIDQYNGTKYPNYNEVIKAIKRFTIRCLTVIAESTVSLIEYLQKQSLWSINIKEESIMSFYFDFPFRDITIAYTFDFLSCFEN